MAAVVLEVTSFGSHKKEYHKYFGPKIVIGRSFDNDLILFDSYVSAHHAKIVRADDSWVVEDIAEENGIIFGRDKRVSQTHVLHSGDSFKLGRTTISFYLSTHKVEPTQLVASKDNFIRQIQNPISLWFSILALILSYAMAQYLGSYEVVKYYKLVTVGFIVLFLSVLWAGAWALVGRMLKNKWNFGLQLTITNYFYILHIPAYFILTLVGYITHNVALEIILTTVTYGVLFVLALAAQLGIASYLSMKKRIISMSSLYAFLVVLIGFIYFSAQSEFSSTPNANTNLFPPFVKIGKSQTVDQFLKGSEKLFLLKK